jgi:hypothetical protein
MYILHIINKRLGFWPSVQEFIIYIKVLLISQAQILPKNRLNIGSNFESHSGD